MNHLALISVKDHSLDHKKQEAAVFRAASCFINQYLLVRNRSCRTGTIGGDDCVVADVSRTQPNRVSSSGRCVLCGSSSDRCWSSGSGGCCLGCRGGVGRICGFSGGRATVAPSCAKAGLLSARNDTNVTIDLFINFSLFDKLVLLRYGKKYLTRSQQ